MSSISPVPHQAEPFALAQVRLLDSLFQLAMERNAAYLLSLEPDRLLHNTRQSAGLPPKGELYGGWEAKGIPGHTLGHYLTALAQQLAATGDQRFRERLDYTIAEMAECQQAYGDGYVGASLPKEIAIMRAWKDGKMEPAETFHFKDGAWMVPWYTQHKILAGLKDAWGLGGCRTAQAVTLKLADWAAAIMAGLTFEQQQEILQNEHGGMLEVLSDLYALTGNDRYLVAARSFYHHAILDPLLDGRDELAGRHANSQIPKIIGAARLSEVTGEPAGRRIAEFFWDRVVHHHSWVIGGNSDAEHFFPEGAAAQHLSPSTAETCNSYNMLRLTEHLLGWEPKVDYADFYERVLYNHILASQEPQRGMFAYYVSLKPGFFRTYSTPFDSFWCCVGTGMENHTKYSGAIYWHGPAGLYVNLFIPSILAWESQGLVLEQQTDYPLGDQIKLTVQSAPVDPLRIFVRCPAWAAGPLQVQLNGQPLAIRGQPGQYAAIQRQWKKDDCLRVTIPMGLRTESLAGTPEKIAFLYGPLVLAGDLGPVPLNASFPYAKSQAENLQGPAAAVPVLVPKDDVGIVSALYRVPGRSLMFRSVGLGRPHEITLRPFAELHYDYYNVYWDVISEADGQNPSAVRDYQ